MNILRKASLGIALLGIVITVHAFGDDAPSQDAGRRRRGPPPEAYTACEGKGVGDEAEFASPHGDTVAGVCEQEGERLVLRPNDAGGTSRRPRGRSSE